MKATMSWAGALASALLLTSTASAQYIVPVAVPPGYAPVLRTPLGIAPDACNPGFYCYCPNGQTVGPNYYLRPCFEPYQGVRPTVYRVPGGFSCTPQAEPQAQYPYHPFARGPRDFFMFRENMDEQQGRLARPNLLP